MVPALGEEIADESEVVGQLGLANLRDVPARDIGVDTVHESGVPAHFWREWSEQVPHTLLMLDVYVEVADEHDATLGANALFAAAELAGLHIALHDVHAII